MKPFSDVRLLSKVLSDGTLSFEDFTALLESVVITSIREPIHQLKNTYRFFDQLLQAAYSLINSTLPMYGLAIVDTKTLRAITFDGQAIVLRPMEPILEISGQESIFLRNGDLWREVFGEDGYSIKIEPNFMNSRSLIEIHPAYFGRVRGQLGNFDSIADYGWSAPPVETCGMNIGYCRNFMRTDAFLRNCWPAEAYAVCERRRA